MVTLADLDWPLQTERLLLRPLTHDDVDAIWAYRGIASVNQWTGGHPVSREELAEHFLTEDRVASTVVIEHASEIIGDLMIEVGDGWAQREVADAARRSQVTLGWTLAEPHQGHGFATEAIGEVLRICFEDLGVRRVIAEAFLANEPSWRLMERLGMRREAVHVADSLHRDHGWLDGVFYAILADEWRARI